MIRLGLLLLELEVDLLQCLLVGKNKTQMKREVDLMEVVLLAVELVLNYKNLEEEIDLMEVDLLLVVEHSFEAVPSEADQLVVDSFEAVELEVVLMVVGSFEVAELEVVLMVVDSFEVV